MKHIAGWFRRNNTIMAQAKDLSRQLTEAWYEIDALAQGNTAYAKEVTSTRDHLHRVARERDQERKKRLAAEDARFDRYMVGDKTLKEAANELRDEYLKSVQICTCDHSTFAGFHDEDCPQFNEEE